MKNILYILTIIISVLVFVPSIKALNSKGIMNNLTGFIEVVDDFDIQRISFTSGRAIEILKKNPAYLVMDFDMLQNGKDRVLGVMGFKDLPPRFIMHSNEKELKTILNKKSIMKPSFSPDGKYIAYLEEYVRERNKPERLREDWFDDWYLYLINSDGSNDRRISNSLLMRFKPSWFPDSKQLAISTKDLKIYVINSETGNEKKIIDFGYAPSVSHDGKKIAYLSHDVNESIKKRILEHSKIKVREYEAITASKGKRHEELLETEMYFIKHSIYLYNIETGENKKLTEEVWIEQPAVWSPDDKYLAYNDRRGVVNDIFVLDVKTGEKEQLKGKHGRVMVWQK